MIAPTDDRDLEEYLAGGSEISRRYKAGSQELPSRTLDRAVLIEARASGSPSPNVTALRPRRMRWMVPLALAATVVLSLAILRDAGMDSHAPVYAPVESSAEQDAAAYVPNAEPAPPATAGESSGTTAREREAPKAEAKTSAPAAATARQTNDMASAELTKEAMSAPEILVAPPPPPVKLDSPAAAASAISFREDRKTLRLAEPLSPEALWLADIRRQLNEGHKDQVRKALQEFVQVHPRHFINHPEAATPFAEFSDLLKPPPVPSEQTK